MKMDTITRRQCKIYQNMALSPVYQDKPENKEEGSENIEKYKWKPQHKLKKEFIGRNEEHTDLPGREIERYHKVKRRNKRIQENLENYKNK